MADILKVVNKLNKNLYDNLYDNYENSNDLDIQYLFSYVTNDFYDGIMFDTYMIWCSESHDNHNDDEKMYKYVKKLMKDYAKHLKLMVKAI